MKNAMDMTAGIGTPECARFRARIFRRHLQLSRAIAAEYCRINRRSGYVEANRWLMAFEKSMKVSKTGLFADCDDQAIIDYSKAKAQKVKIDAMEAGRRLGGQALIAFCERACVDAGIDFPLDLRPGDTEEKRKERQVAACARVFCDRWWRRQLRVKIYRQFEMVARGLGMVSRKRSVYVSGYTLARRKGQRRRNARLLESLQATNETGYTATLADMAAAGQANPVNRRGELMLRLRGYSEIADSLGLDSVFLTVTAPGCFHAVLSNGYKNPNFNGATPRGAQEYLTRLWSIVRALWHSAGLRFFGFRIAEPHHDGTPHWHILLFGDADSLRAGVDILRREAMRAEPEELVSHSARDARFDVVWLDHARRAVAYIAKYVSKNIDGAAVVVDFENGDDARVTAKAVDAWASVWGIRQFQQIGSVSVTVYRELRRMVRAELLAGDDPELLRQIAAAADAGDWARFVELMGGALVSRKDQPVRALHVLADKENQYGEQFKRLRGIIMGAVSKITRIHTWTVGRVAVGSVAGSGAGTAPPWSCVNNCNSGVGYG